MWECLCSVLLYLFKLVYFFYDLITFYLRQAKRETWDTFFFYCNYARMQLYFIIAFIKGSSLFWLTGSTSIYCGILRLVMMFEKKSLRTVAVFFVSFCNVALFNKSDFFIRKTLFDNTDLTTPQNFLLPHNIFSLRLP